MNFLLSILLSVFVSAQLDSTELWIGAQDCLHLSAVSSDTTKVQMPVFDQEITAGVEIVSRSEVKTSQRDGQTVTEQDYIITSFQDSLFLIPALPFVSGGDTFYSEPVSLNVIQPFVVDTTDAITDIKPIQKAPIWWWGILRWVLLVLLIAALAWLGYVLYHRYARKTGTEEEEVNPELLRPCDEVALEKLDAIKEEKRWLQGEHKEYFTDLTFVIREYISRRFDISSTEKTSDETLNAVKPILIANEQKDLYTQLDKMLRLADLVKFAKWQPTPDENETSLRSAYDFVNETKPGKEEPTQQGDVSEQDFESI
ncbi:MAG: hypothetical protein IJS13_08285 [Paludibacteraceae bacterium]|nr:hypothetical protein [Paludibacteraceae bacterium]